MRKPIITLILLFLLLIFYGKSQTTIADSSKVNFYKAYSALQNMLKGKDSLDYEKAVFITENAYHDNYFKYKDFKQLLDLHTGIITAFADDVREKYKDKYPTLRDFEQRMFNPNINNWAIFKYITDTAFVIINKDKYYKTPYNYTAYDPYGSDNWENTQVLSLLLSNKKQGNCYSLAVLFKLFSDRLQSDARLTITPHHIYIQNRNQRGGFYNVELASKTFPGDGSIQTLTYTTNTSIMNGMAQRKLTDKEAVALNLIYLAKGYQHKYKDNTNDFLLQCAGLAFKYDTLSMNALLLKAEITENRLLASMKENKITKLSKARVNPQTKLLLASYEKQLSDLYKFGYREIPKEIERNILAHIQHKEEGYILKDQTPNPFASIKAKTRYKTLSNGLFDEIHEAIDTIQYYHALLNTKSKKIIKLLPIDKNDDYKVDPVVFALSVDPLSDKYPNISPYAYCNWNPVVLVDPDGRDIKPISISENKKLMESLGKFSSVFTLSTYNGKYNVGGASGEYGSCNIISTTTSSESFRRKLEKSNLTSEEKTQARALYRLISTEDIIEIGTIDSKTTMNKSSVTSSNDFEYCATTNATAKDLINNKSKTQNLIQGILGAQNINSLKNDNIMPYGFFPESDQKTSVDNHGGVFRGLLLINPDDNTHDSSNESYINTIVDFSKKYYIQKNSNEN